MAIVADEIQLGKGNVGIKTYSEGVYDSGYTDCGATTEKGVTFNYKADADLDFGIRAKYSNPDEIRDFADEHPSLYSSFTFPLDFAAGLD